MCRDEIKRKQGAEQRIDNIIREVILGLRLVKNHPELWRDQRMQEANKLVYEIMGDPEKYIPHTNQPDWGLGLDDLTKNVSNRLDQRDFPHMRPSDEPLCLVITNATPCDWGKTKVDDGGNAVVNFRTWRFGAADGDNKYVHIRLDSTLSTEGNLLTTGTVILIKKFLPVYYSYENLHNNMVAVVVREFEIVGRCQVPTHLLEAPKESDRAQPLPEATKKRKKSTKKKKAAATEEEQNCDCTGNLCSIHGTEFVVCLTQCVPVSEASLPLVARGCVFATREFEDMSQSDKRFLLYYHYATTVYQFHGKDNRIQLPECLKKAIRDSYPDEQLESSINSDSDSDN